MHISKITVIGVGLIGASLALALRKKGLCSEISGSGRTEKNLIKAKEKHIIDTYSLNHAEACRNADIIVFATPVGLFKGVISEIQGSVKEGAIITDVGSVKGNLVYELEANTPKGVNYIGAHPIAGSDLSGIDAAYSDLFHNALCVITPTGKSDTRSIQTIKALWSHIGARVVELSPEEHDRIFSAVSHMPHAAAYALVNTVAKIDPSFIDYAGQGFKDSTRIALSSPELWTDICQYNNKNIIKHLEALMENLNLIKSSLEKEDYTSLKTHFMKAKELRKRLG